MGMAAIGITIVLVFVLAWIIDRAVKAHERRPRSHEEQLNDKLAALKAALPPETYLVAEQQLRADAKQPPT